MLLRAPKLNFVCAKSYTHVTASSSIIYGV